MIAGTVSDLADANHLIQTRKRINVGNMASGQSRVARDTDLIAETGQESDGLRAQSRIVVQAVTRGMNLAGRATDQGVEKDPGSTVR